MNESEMVSHNFIKEIINEELTAGKHQQIVTRLPPEPNGYIHIGHAKAFLLNYGIARDYKGRCNLRFDDTNPVKEEVEYIEGIKRDIAWLGIRWDDLFFASDYFDELYQLAVQLIRSGAAYVDQLSAEQIREYRGTLTKPGQNSPWRERSIEENIDLFERMKQGEFGEKSMVLRAKIDMASPNINMRDPVMYRIIHAPHPHVGDKWCIYPMYDWAHGIGDSIEGVTHSLCSLEYEDHRPLYNWFLDTLGIYRPRQIEFARLNLSNTVMSKRYLLRLVNEKVVNGWDDPRMPTICGLRRRGYTAAAIRDFIGRVGTGKTFNTVDIAMLENCLREDLNIRANRAFAVLKPLKLIIDNYPADQVEWLEAENNPEDAAAGSRQIPFSRELWIEQDDFKTESPGKKYYRFAPGNEVRLKHAYYITCVGFDCDDAGNITAIHGRYDPDSRGGWTDDGRKVRGTSHWLSAAHACPAEIRNYGPLFNSKQPGSGDRDLLNDINPDSLTTLNGCFVEKILAEAPVGQNFQFLRQGYYCKDADSTDELAVFNLAVALRDSWTKIEKKL